MLKIRTEEQRLRRNEQVRAQWAALSAEEKQIALNVRRRNRAKRLAAMSDEERRAMYRAKHDAYKQKFPERYKAYMDKYNAAYHQRKREERAGRPAPEHCECCQEKPTPKRKKTLMVLDHDHATGIFRGWICQRCNVVLGQIRDDPNMAYKLIIYLERTTNKRFLRSS